MPIKFEIDYPNDLTRFTVTGAITFKDILDTFAPYLKAGITRFILYDVSEGTLGSLTSKQADQVLRWIIENTDKRPAGSKTAIVAAKDADLKTLNLLQQHDEIKEINWEAKMFHSLYEAYEWLTLPPEKS